MKGNVLLVMGMASLLCGCASVGGKKESPTMRRLGIRNERDAILAAVYEKQPGLREKVSKAAGYATFSTVNVNLLLLATARGDGMAVDNATGKETFMKVASVGGGLGAGIKDLRALFVFNERAALEQFIDSGWQFGAQADASLKSGDKGAELGESVSVAEGKDGGLDTGMTGGVSATTKTKSAIEVYQITEAGISLQATIAGTKYWKDDELN